MCERKVFLITIDTEEDNQWEYSNSYFTKNVKYLPRFQELCEKYNFKPTWLITYAIASDDEFVNFFKAKQENGYCEIGMHLHGWNCPPNYKLNSVNKERAYITEYPSDIIEKKVENITNIIIKKFGVNPISHRGGRWIINDEYLDILSKYGYKIDCSVTPYIDWSRNFGATGIKGPNYRKFYKKQHVFNNGILEIPLTVKKVHSFQYENIHSIKDFLISIKDLLLGKFQWVRPDSKLSFHGIKKLIDKCTDDDYVMFMIHSSELMPGGSPYFKDEQTIEKLYTLIEKIFSYAKSKGYEGFTLKDYYNYYINKKQE